MKKENILVNICYEINNKRKCATLSKEEAYMLKKQVLKMKGTVYWFDPVNTG